MQFLLGFPPPFFFLIASFALLFSQSDIHTDICSLDQREPDCVL